MVKGGRRIRIGIGAEREGGGGKGGEKQTGG